jgi:hypothetical protein
LVNALFGKNPAKKNGALEGDGQRGGETKPAAPVSHTSGTAGEWVTLRQLTHSLF